MKSSKHIVILTSEFPPQPGGIGNHAYNLAKHLSKHEFKVTVVTDYRSQHHTFENNFDVTLDFKVIRIRRYYFNLFTYLKRLLVVRKYVKNQNPDVVISSGKFSLWLVAFGVQNQQLHKIAIVHGSEVNLKIKWQRKLVYKALQQFDKIIAVSNFTKSLIANRGYNNITVIPNGFAVEKFQQPEELQHLKGFPKLITVGNLSQRKGQHNVVEKLPELVKIYHDCHYHMVGTPSEKDKLMNLAKSLKVEKHITFHGITDQNKLNYLLNESDIFVMLSEETKSGDVEGFGIALLEANYMGLPAIGSKNCGIEDAIHHFHSGILIQPESTEEFIKAVQEIIGNMGFYKKSAKEWSLKHTWDLISKQYIQLILEK